MRNKSINIFVVLYFFVIAMLSGAVCYANISAPDGVITGELAIIKSSTTATWTVYPSEYKSAIYITDDGRTCVFASPKPGAVTFVAASVIDGKVEISEKTIYNGIDAPPSDDTKPIPEPEPEPETVATVVKNAKVEATVTDYNALISAFETTVSGIDRGTIRSVAGARETFRSNWIYQAGKNNPNAINLFAQLLSDLSEKIDNTSLLTLKADYSLIIEALQERAKETEVKAKSEVEAKKENPPAVQSCPNGNCSTNTRWRFIR